ncbi:MAG: hypothetical protein HKN23_15005 [Verrucomicrobiales bacterium]|nr:hypothetical protein [Verrucomicrobiales bacterium]
MKTTRFAATGAAAALCLLLSCPSITEAQIRTSPIVKPVTIKRDDRNKSNLAKEDGAIYLDGLLNQEVIVKITKPAPAYTNLTGQRWIGTVHGNQKAVLLAVSDKAYRVRARAQQGQIAGWISKAAVEGLNDQFEENLKKFYERHVLVEDLISKEQVAMGMTVNEVMESIGEPSKRSTKVDKEGRKDILEYITYDRIPQTTIARDRFGQPFQTVTYIEVETGRVKIEFENDMVSSIEESEGTDFGKGGVRIVPPPIFLF